MVDVKKIASTLIYICLRERKKIKKNYKGGITGGVLVLKGGLIRVFSG